MNGVLIIDKPPGLTSHDVVNRVRRILGERSVGHLGTLDPMATGVLPLVTGNFTRLAQFYMGSEKCYEGTIRFGFSTDTYDAEGEPTSPPKAVILSKEMLEALAARFRGVIEQTPPPFSAKKIKGVPAYKLARQQKEVVLQPVQVEVKEFGILSIESDRATFRARVASGTYMRSIAHDLGQALGCGAHLESLRRTAVAEFTIADAHTLDALQQTCHPGRVPSPEGSSNPEASQQTCHPDRSFPSLKGKESEVEGPAFPDTINELFIHPRKLLPQFPCVTADEITTAQIRSGRTVNLPELSRARQIKVFSSQRDLISIATRIAGTLFHPKIVLCGSDTPVRQG
jgi:tRNA pseudouridine55 synthase